MIDRVNVTGTVWLGTTLECCQCHNHKYDPFTQRDYYQFFAFFNNTPKETYQRTKGSAALDFGGPEVQLSARSGTRQTPRAKLTARQQEARRRLGAVPGRRSHRPGRLGATDGRSRRGRKGQAAGQHPPRSRRRRRKTKQESEERSSQLFCGLHPEAKKIQAEMDGLQKQLDALAPPNVARHGRNERAGRRPFSTAAIFSRRAKKSAPARRESCPPSRKTCPGAALASPPGSSIRPIP